MNLGMEQKLLNNLFSILQVETVVDMQCYHIVVYVVIEGDTTTFTLVSYQPGLDVYAPLQKLIAFGDGGVKMI